MSLIVGLPARSHLIRVKSNGCNGDVPRSSRKLCGEPAGGKILENACLSGFCVKPANCRAQVAADKLRHAKSMSGEAVHDLFVKSGVREYLLKHFESLHTTGNRYIIDDIDEFLGVHRAA